MDSFYLEMFACSNILTFLAILICWHLYFKTHFIYIARNAVRFVFVNAGWTDNNVHRYYLGALSMQACVKRTVRKLRPQRTRLGLHCSVKSTLNACRTASFIAGSRRQERELARYGSEIVIAVRCCLRIIYCRATVVRNWMVYNSRSSSSIL